MTEFSPQKRRNFKHPLPAKLIIAVMWRSDFKIEPFIKSKIISNFGSIEDRSGVFDFNHTGYYKKEMGEALKKEFISFEGKVSKDSLISYKHKTFDIEQEFLDINQCRKVNLDPMLLSLENLVIATSKSFPHRVYIGDGVYGDVGLLRNKGAFEKLPWTYADYWEKRDFFDLVRNRI